MLIIPGDDEDAAAAINRFNSRDDDLDENDN
jgi:hypothetical protein